MFILMTSVLDLLEPWIWRMQHEHEYDWMLLFELECLYLKQMQKKLVAGRDFLHEFVSDAWTSGIAKATRQSTIASC